jgi:hypothetical protein
MPAVPPDYDEIDLSLGRNVVGQILSVLSQHIASSPGGGRDDTITAGVRRRDDERDVELTLSVIRSRRQGQECLLLFKLGEHELD